MRLDVARAARIRVVAPGAANIGGAFEDEEVVDPVALQPDCGTQPGEAAADDRDARAHALRPRFYAIGKAAPRDVEPM